MHTISIRPCGPGDENSLSVVGQASFLEAFAGIVSGRDILTHCRVQHPPEKYREWVTDGRSKVWIAEIDPGQAPVGYLILTSPDLPLPDIGPTDIEIKRVYLLHKFQGQGIGARLMREAHVFAEANGYVRILLGVYSQNTASIAFYEKFGYKKVGTRRFKVGDNHYDDFIFAFTLSKKIAS
jgi:diamine N-acetyltransferase